MHTPSEPALAAVKTYIKQTWKTLTRSPANIIAAAFDEKIAHGSGQPWPIYISEREDFTRAVARLQAAVTPEDFARIAPKLLPPEADAIEQHGLLYLPGQYVVPGGRFNELYGWDSYFILLGLMRDEEYALARSLVEQLLYEVQHYGTVLNANRTYFLNRSQPPFLSQMVLCWFEHARDLDWLKSTLPQLESYYYYWTVPPHLNQTTGLSHYFAVGDGPAPEVLFSERDAQGRTHFDRVKEYYRTQQVVDYDPALYYDRERDCLTELFYKGDRSMRESGLDPTNRFGPFSVDIIHYAPVCLNVLLCQMEKDLARINHLVQHADIGELWYGRAQQRVAAIDRYLWDEEAGLYFDYNFRTGCRRQYRFATTFYPLWAGIASPRQAQRAIENLPDFEAPGGVRTSDCVSGNQWDAPFGWAPLQLLAVRGLLNYGYTTEARRLAQKFIDLVVEDFQRCGSLLEKYDIEARTGEVSDEIQYGYSTNEIGFGWTNGVFLELLSILDELP